MNNPLVQPDPGLFIWTILTFLGLLVLLKAIAWGPLLKALDSRQETIRKSLDDAQLPSRSWSGCSRNQPRSSGRPASRPSRSSPTAAPTLSA